jgi:ABC-type lipoprotein export system ATPase subunit
MTDRIIVCNNLVKCYRVADLQVVALQHLNLEVASGELLRIAGPSGAGKSTLLNILGGLDVPDGGSCFVAGNDLTHMTARQRVDYRHRIVGQVWRYDSRRNLLPDLSIQANIELPQMLGGVEAAQRAARTRELLAKVGLSGKEHCKPGQLSVDEQQRSAIAVALANRPRILLADEPIGNWQGESAAAFFALLHVVKRVYDLTIIIATCDLVSNVAVDRTLVMRSGSLVTD